MFSLALFFFFKIKLPYKLNFCKIPLSQVLRNLENRIGWPHALAWQQLAGAVRLPLP